MAASAWKVYTKAKKKLGNGTIKLGGGSGEFRIKYCKSGSNAESGLATVSTLASVSTEISARGGYAAGGDLLSSAQGFSPIWTVSGSVVKFGFGADPVLTASGSAISDVVYAVIGYSASGGTVHALCWSKLTTTGNIDITTNNAMTVTLPSNKVFTLGG